VAGGLFAQATFTGRIFGGFRATTVEHSQNWALGWYNNSLGAANQVRLDASYRNEARTIGGNLSLRANLALGGNDVVPFFSIYRGWFTMFDGMVKVLGGKWTESEFCEQYYSGGGTYWGSGRPGIAVYAYPLDDIRVGVGVNASSSGTLQSDLRYWFGAAYETETFGVYTSGAVQKDNINWFLSGFVDTNDIVVAYDFDFQRLDAFADKGKIVLQEFVGYYGIEDVDIEFDSEQDILTDGSDPELNFGLSFAYYGLDVPGITKVGIDLGTDLESFSYKPYVRFGVGAGEKYIQLDYEGTLDFETSKYSSAIGLSFRWNF